MNDRREKIAIISAHGLGDGLLTMVLANNLQRHGYVATVFSNYLVQMRQWFPERQIEPYPDTKTDGQTIHAMFQAYDKIISTDGAPLYIQRQAFSEKYKIFFESDFDRTKTILQNFLDICRKDFHLHDLTMDNGITVPSGLAFKKYANRVIIHPMSTSKKKNWLPERFLKLADKLVQRNYEPVFIVSPAERPQWEQAVLTQGFKLPFFPTADALAQYVYESGYMIGNDSGVGHLAANLGIPTISLFSRNSIARLWRPGWGNGTTVTPLCQLPGARLRIKYWKKFLTVNKVLSTFENLVRDK